jgi:predicted ATPase
LESAESAAYLLALLSLPPDECIDLLHAYSPAQMESTLLALVSLIQALASKQPIVLLVRDIQWCDPFTLRLLALLAGSDLKAPILIVLTNHAASGSAIDSQLHTQYPRITAA